MWKHVSGEKKGQSGNDVIHHAPGPTGLRNRATEDGRAMAHKVKERGSFVLV